MRRDSGPSNAQDTNKIIAVSQGQFAYEHNTYVAGQRTVSPGKTQIVTWKYNDDGTVAWERTWPETSQGLAYAVAAVYGSGGLYIAGTFAKEGEGLNIVVLHYDDNGDLFPSSPFIYNNPAQNGDDVPIAMSDLSTGALWLIGSSAGAGTGTDFVTIAVPTDNPGGLQQPIIIRYNHLSNKADVPAAIKVMPLLRGGGPIPSSSPAPRSTPLQATTSSQSNMW